MPTTRPTTATVPRSTGISSRSSGPTTAAAPSPSTASRSASTAGSSPPSCRRSTPNDVRPTNEDALMPLPLILGLALLGQAKPDPDLFPLALHRSMEIDDLDREIQRSHDTVIM